MAAEFNIDDIIADWGTHDWTDGAPNMIKILEKEEGTLLNYARPIYTDKPGWRGVLATGTRLLQACKCDWSPLGGLTFSPIEWLKHCMKVDWESCPHEYLFDNWFSFLRGKKLDSSTWPFVQWLMQNYIGPQVTQDLTENELWNGVRVAPPAGSVPGGAGEGMDGLSKIIQDILVAGYTTAIPSGAWSTTPSVFVQELENWFEQIPTPFINKVKEIFVSPEILMRYKRGYQQRYGMLPCCNTDRDDNLISIMLHQNTMLVGLHEMVGSDRVWTTTPDNLIALYDKDHHLGDFEIEKAKRAVAIWSNFRLGLGFEDPRVLFTNELI